MNEVSVFMVLLMFLGGGAGNDLLDLVSSENYWKAKDIELTVPAIMLELNSLQPDDTSKEIAVRRLMAIRTLGELRRPDAIPTLRSQLERQEPFVAEYALRAIETIEGKEPKSAGVPPDRMQADLMMLPEGLGVVAQFRLESARLTDRTQKKEAPVDQPEAEPNPMDAVAMGLIGFAERVGNIRVDALTFGLAQEVGPNQGYATIYVRGKWDAEAIRGLIQSEFTQTRTESDTEFMSPTIGQVAAAVVSDEFFVFSGGEPGPPLAEIGEAIRNNKGKFENNTELVKVVESIDKSQPIWAAMRVSGTYTQAPILAPFQHLTLSGKPDQEGMKIQIKGVGTDPDAVSNAVQQLKEMISQGREELSREVERQPMLRPMLDTLNSIEVESEGVNATGKATIKRGLPMFMGYRAEAEVVPAQ